MQFTSGFLMRALLLLLALILVVEVRGSEAGEDSSLANTSRGYNESNAVDVDYKFGSVGIQGGASSGGNKTIQERISAFIDQFSARLSRALAAVKRLIAVMRERNATAKPKETGQLSPKRRQPEAGVKQREARMSALRNLVERLNAMLQIARNTSVEVPKKQAEVAKNASVLPTLTADKKERFTLRERCQLLLQAATETQGAFRRADREFHKRKPSDLKDYDDDADDDEEEDAGDDDEDDDELLYAQYVKRRVAALKSPVKQMRRLPDETDREMTRRQKPDNHEDDWDEDDRD
ncbi:unnamed protein product [Schistocephalus solidus]|uniref:Secreted protein n=1 Tax=Schistocephalus solidus TaxID=70667 RepID=A0A183TL65_SCHSO|nr:unnamed protein product [Schistocephalus solidus]